MKIGNKIKELNEQRDALIVKLLRDGATYHGRRKWLVAVSAKYSALQRKTVCCVVRSRRMQLNRVGVRHCPVKDSPCQWLPS